MHRTTTSNSDDALKALWTAMGVSAERQEELLAQIAAKARAGAQVGPFRVKPLLDQELLPGTEQPTDGPL